MSNSDRPNNPTERDLLDRIDELGSDPDPSEVDVDSVKTWKAFLNARHPLEMDSRAESDLLRWHWSAPLDPDTDPRDMTGKEIDEFDARIRRAIETHTYKSQTCTTNCRGLSCVYEYGHPP